MTRFCLNATALLAVAFVGCGGATSDRRAVAVPPDEREQITRYLASAGLRGELSAVEDAGDHWKVVVESADSIKRTASPDGNSELIELPKIHYVYKADGRVVDPDKPPPTTGKRRKP